MRSSLIIEYAFVGAVAILIVGFALAYVLMLIRKAWRVG